MGMRTASLEPYHCNDSTARPWCLSVPAHLSDTGKRKRQYFATKKAGKAEAERLEARRDNFGVSLTAMTPARIAEAAEAYKLLDPLNVKLLDAVREYVETHKARVASVPFGQLFDLFLEAKAGRSEKYRGQLRWAKERFAGLHDRLAADVTVRDVDEILKGEKATVKNAWMRYLRAVFNYGVKRDYLATNPIDKLDFEQVTKGETEIFEPGVVKAILDDCLEHDLALLPYRVIGFFCGVRPEGELTRLEWADLDQGDRVLKLRAEITKKRRLRFVDVSANAMAWLEAYKARGGNVEGSVTPFSPADLRDHHRANWGRVVGVTKAGKPKRRWIQQGMRHSFCSYWLALHEDIDRLVIQSGHESKEVMWRNYYRHATKAKAEKFWEIMPVRADAPPP
jgi:integrase